MESIWDGRGSLPGAQDWPMQRSSVYREMAVCYVEPAEQRQPRPRSGGPGRGKSGTVMHPGAWCKCGQPIARHLVRKKRTRCALCVAAHQESASRRKVERDAAIEVALLANSPNIGAIARKFGVAQSLVYRLRGKLLGLGGSYGAPK